MLKILASLLLLLSLSLPAGAADQKSRALGQLILQATVSLAGPEKQKDGSTELAHFCAGVLVAAKQVLTAYHCIEGTFVDRVIVVAFNGKQAKGVRVLRRAEERDLILFEIDAALEGTRAAKISTDIAVNDPVWLAGSTAGEPFIISYGRIGKIFAEEYFANCDPKDVEATKPQQWVVFTGPWYYGNSGGGLWNEEGMLIGIQSRGRFAGTAMCVTEDDPNTPQVEGPRVVLLDEGGPTFAWLVGPKALLEFLEVKP